MKHEGFLNKALKIVKEKDLNARFLLNESSFNFPDNTRLSPSNAANISFAIQVQNQDFNDLDKLADKAANVRTVGGAKKIIKQVDEIIQNRKS